MRGIRYKSNHANKPLVGRFFTPSPNDIEGGEIFSTSSPSNFRCIIPLSISIPIMPPPSPKDDDIPEDMLMTLLFSSSVSDGSLYGPVAPSRVLQYSNPIILSKAHSGNRTGSGNAQCQLIVGCSPPNTSLNS